MKKLFFTTSLFLSIIFGANAQDFASVDLNFPINQELPTYQALDADGKFVNCIIARKDSMGECTIPKFGLCGCQWFSGPRASINNTPKTVWREINPNDINNTNNTLTISAKEFTKYKGESLIISEDIVAPENIANELGFKQFIIKAGEYKSSSDDGSTFLLNIIVQ